MGAAPVDVGGGIVWVELNGLGEVGHGAVQIKRREMRGPPTEIRGGIIGVGFNCFTVISDEKVGLLLLVPISPCWRHPPPRCQSKRKRSHHSRFGRDLHDRRGVPTASMARSVSLLCKMFMTAQGSTCGTRLAR